MSIAGAAGVGMTCGKMRMLELETPADFRNFVAPYRIDRPEAFRLASCDPGDTNGLDKDFKDDAAALLSRGVDRMADHQAMLAAQARWSLLVILQARDAAGKDSTIKHVMTGLNPQGCTVTSFKHPGQEALSRDFLWRYHVEAPPRGHIGIFNRSYYEEVLIVRVHEQLLRNSRLPDALVGPGIWHERFEDINAFERLLARSGVRILKFFLHVSKDEQKKRFLERLEHPEKHWKFSRADIDERRYWDDYTHAYEEVIRHTSTAVAPWYVVPADAKWFTRLVVASAIVGELQSLDLSYPPIDDATRRELEEARRDLEDL